MDEHRFRESLSPSPGARDDYHAHGSAVVAQALARLLTTTQLLCRQSLYTHWQEIEPNFNGLHSLFEQHYQSLRLAANSLADRIHALGYILPSSYSEPAWGTQFSDSRTPEEMLIGLIRNHQIGARDAKKVVDLADMTGDDVSANLAAQRAAVHERAALVLLALMPANRSMQS